MCFDNLFNPIKLRGLEIKNRVLFPAIGTKMLDGDKFVTDQLINYHVARANGGNGINFTEVCSVYDKSAPSNFLSISDDKYIPNLKKLADSIHSAGGKAGVQLWLGGTAVLFKNEISMAVVPSDITIKNNFVIPGATVNVIHEAITAFGDAAKRAVLAGYDTVLFHAGHNYTPHCFLSKAFNKRTDDYGGSFENRCRFLIECIKSIRNNIPEDMPLFMRVSAQDDYLKDGLTLDETIEFCKLAKEAGVDAVDVSRGNFSSAAIKYEVPPVDLPRGFNVENAAKIKKETGLITIAVGRINDPEQANEIIKSGKADMVAIGRAQLTDPEFCNKAKAGRINSIVRCVGCNQGCYDGFASPDVAFITCLRNPVLGKESEYPIPKAPTSKRVLVIGGGVSGLSAAMTLKAKGHTPILCEETASLGGQFVLAGAAPRKSEIMEAALALGAMTKRKVADIRLSTKVTPQIIEEINPDAVIIAGGSSPINLNIPGSNLNHVFNSHDVLAGKLNVTGNIVVIGGGLVGLEVAEFLSSPSNKITVIEMLDEVAKDLGHIRKICVIENLKTEAIDTITSAKCIEIKEHSIIIDKNNILQEIPCDYVVVAIGAKSRDFKSISTYCNQIKIPHYIIGDALKARRALNCIQEAVDVVREIF